MFLIEVSVHFTLFEQFSPCAIILNVTQLVHPQFRQTLPRFLFVILGIRAHVV